MESHILELEGCPLHFWTAGPTGRPLVVFTHGVMMDHRIFGHQVADLAKDYRVLVWDVRGHGHSRPLGESFSVRRAANDLIAILNHLKIDNAVLVGHSMGGYIAQEVAFLQTRRVAALVMIGSMCWTCRPGWRLRAGQHIVPAIFRVAPHALVRWLTGVVAGVKPDTRALARQVSEPLGRRDRVQLWIAIMHGFHEESNYRIEPPLLLTHGVRDNIIGFGIIPHQMQAWAGRVPTSQYIPIPAAGHNAHQDNPEFFNRILREFLAARTR